MTHVHRLAMLAIVGFALAPVIRAEKSISSRPPDQAVVFVGDQVFVVGFTEDGVIAQDGRILAGRGVYSSGFPVHPAFSTSLVRESCSLPAAPVIRSDCDAVRVFETAIAPYLPAADGTLQCFQRSITQCISEIHALGIQIQNLIAEAPDLGEELECALYVDSIGVGEASQLGLIDLPRCNQCGAALAEIADRVEVVSELALQCGRARHDLAHLRTTIERVIAEQGGLTCVDRFRFRSSAFDLVAAAELLEPDAAVAAGDVRRLAPKCEIETLTRACESCGGGERFPLPPSGVVLSVGESLGRFSAEFRRAAGRSDDPAEKARLVSAAEYLHDIPKDRRVEYVFRGGGTAGTSFVCLWPPSVPDDGQSPRAVILTALPSDARFPELNGAGARIVVEALRLARETMVGRKAPALPAIDVSPSFLNFSAIAGGNNPAAQTLNVSNPGGGVLDYSASGNATWLSVKAATGTAPDSISVSVNISDLPAGKRDAIITINAPEATNSPMNVPVALTLTQGPNPPP